MQRTFIILPEFDKNWKSMGLSAERNNIRKVIECLEHTVRS